MKTSNIVTVLDIGSSKVCCCIANISGHGKFSILGVGYCMCVGVKHGVIVDVETVKISVAKAVEAAEKAANFIVKSVYVNISGKNVKSKIVNASANLGGRIVRPEDVFNLLSVCDSQNNQLEIIHAIPIMYSIDSLTGIKDPVGMIANNLNISINVVTVQKEQLNNILVCLARCHLEPEGIVETSYASGLCVLSENDANIPHIIIDLGSSNTYMAFFYNGIYCGSEIVPIGGKHITNDIAYGLNISYVSAERLKTLHGAAFVSRDDERDVVLAPVIEDDNVIDLQQISKSTLNQIIQSRVEEIFKNVKKKADESIFKNDFNNCNIILTGGGSQLTGIRDFASEILVKKVKIKKTNNFNVDSPVQIENDFSVALGMIKFAQISNGKLLNKKALNNNNEKTNFFKKALIWIENNI